MYFLLCSTGRNHLGHRGSGISTRLFEIPGIECRARSRSRYPHSLHSFTSWNSPSCIVLESSIHKGMFLLGLDQLETTHHVTPVVTVCYLLPMLVISARLAPVSLEARRLGCRHIDVRCRSQDWNATIPSEPHRELIEVQRLDDGYAFSRDHVRGEMGAVLRFEFSGSETLTILESSMPPCSPNGDVVQHVPSEVYDGSGKRHVEIKTKRDATTYLFILSESQAQCSPMCCFTFLPMPSLNLNTGAVLSTALFPTATAGRNLPSGTFLGTALSDALTMPSHILVSAGSLATGTLHVAPAGGARTISPPIENEGAVAAHASWLSVAPRLAASLWIASWLAG